MMLRRGQVGCQPSGGLRRLAIGNARRREELAQTNGPTATAHDQRRPMALLQIVATSVATMAGAHTRAAKETGEGCGSKRPRAHARFISCGPKGSHSWPG